MLLPDDLTPALPGYRRIVVCALDAVDAVLERVAALPPDVAALVVVIGTGYLATGEGYTWHKPLTKGGR